MKENIKFPVRILHVVTRMDSAGIETFLMNVYRNIDRKIIQFDFLTHRADEGFYDAEIKKLGGKIFHVPNISPFHHATYIKSLDAFFSKHKEYNIVHSHINAFSMYILRSAKKNGVQNRIAHSHTTKLEINHKYIFKKYCLNKINDYTTLSLACSQEAGEFLFSDNEFSIINNGINTDMYVFNKKNRMKIRRNLNIEDKFVIGNIGRLVKSKNHKFLLSVFNEIVKLKEDSVLLLVGKGPLKSKILNEAEKFGIEKKIIILEDRDDVADILQAMDVFVFPSKFEGLGIVAIESQASSLPTYISKNLPVELNVSSLVKRISLEEKPKEWAQKIVSSKVIERDLVDLSQLNKEFDIKNVSNDLQKIYTSFQ